MVLSLLTEYSLDGNAVKGLFLFISPDEYTYIGVSHYCFALCCVRKADPERWLNSHSVFALRYRRFITMALFALDFLMDYEV